MSPDLSSTIFFNIDKKKKIHVVAFFIQSRLPFPNLKVQVVVGQNRFQMIFLSSFAIFLIPSNWWACVLHNTFLYIHVCVKTVIIKKRCMLFSFNFMHEPKNCENNFDYKDVICFRP